MKKYNRPEIIDENVELEDVIAQSLVEGVDGANDPSGDKGAFSGLFGNH